MFKRACLCGQKPKLKTRPVTEASKVRYFYYTCSNKQCIYGITTFSTRKEEFCRELWNSTVLNKIRKL